MALTPPQFAKFVAREIHSPVRLAHTCVLQGHLTAFIQDESGRRLDIRLGPWECIACPPGVIHGYINESLEPIYFQVMLGRARPETMGYADDELYRRRDAHLK